MPRFAARKKLTDQCDQTLISKHETQPLSKSSLSHGSLLPSVPKVVRGGGGSCSGRLSIKGGDRGFSLHSIFNIDGRLVRIPWTK